MFSTEYGISCTVPDSAMLMEPDITQMLDWPYQLSRTSHSRDSIFLLVCGREKILLTPEDWIIGFEVMTKDVFSKQYEKISTQQWGI